MTSALGQFMESCAKEKSPAFCSRFRIGAKGFRVGVGNRHVGGSNRGAYQRAKVGVGAGCVEARSSTV